MMTTMTLAPLRIGPRPVILTALGLMLPLLTATAAATEPEATRPDTGGDVRCGSNCLMTALMAMDRGPADLQTLEDMLGTAAAEGYSLQQLISAAERCGASTAAVRTSPQNLQQRGERFACIALLNNDHYALIADMTDGTALVVDPPRTYEIPVDTLMTQWDGTALLISDRQLEREEALTSRLWRKWFTGILLRFAGGGLAAVVLLGAAHRVHRVRSSRSASTAA